MIIQRRDGKFTKISTKDGTTIVVDSITLLYMKERAATQERSLISSLVSDGGLSLLENWNHANHGNLAGSALDTPQQSLKICTKGKSKSGQFIILKCNTESDLYVWKYSVHNCNDEISNLCTHSALHSDSVNIHLKCSDLQWYSLVGSVRYGPTTEGKVSPYKREQNMHVKTATVIAEINMNE